MNICLWFHWSFAKCCSDGFWTFWVENEGSFVCRELMLTCAEAEMLFFQVRIGQKPQAFRGSQVCLLSSTLLVAVANRFHELSLCCIGSSQSEDKLGERPFPEDRSRRGYAVWEFQFEFQVSAVPEDKKSHSWEAAVFQLLWGAEQSPASRTREDGRIAGSLPKHRNNSPTVHERC